MEITDCKCKAGYTGEDGSICQACAAGTYKSDAGDSECSRCPTGATSPEASALSSDCICKAGWESLASGVCTACERGYYKAAPGGAACSACASGSFTNRTNSTACQVCPPNSDSAAGSSVCACNSGFYGLPQGSTRAGTVGVLELVTGEDRGCLPCATGLYKETSGSDYCLDCPSGKYNRLPGSSACDDCPAFPSNADDSQLLLQCRDEYKFACQTKRLPFACFLTQYLPLADSLSSCTAFGGALVRVSSSLPILPLGGADTHLHNDLTLEHAHMVDSAWGSLLQFALELTQADEGFYWPGHLESEDELVSYLVDEMSDMSIYIVYWN